MPAQAPAIAALSHPAQALAPARPAPAGNAAAASTELDVRDAHLARCLERARQGDAAAFEAFYDASFAAARTLARRVLWRLEPAAVEDLLADAYFEAWRQVARFDVARGSAMTWLLTLVRSRCLDLLRARAAQPSVGGSVGGDTDEGAAAGAPMADSAPDPVEALWARQASARLHAALAQLSPPERWVLGLAYLREMSQREIAAATGLPLGTVKSHARRAQARLAELLAGSRRPTPE